MAAMQNVAGAGLGNDPTARILKPEQIDNHRQRIGGLGNDPTARILKRP